VPFQPSRAWTRNLAAQDRDSWPQHYQLDVLHVQAAPATSRLILQARRGRGRKGLCRPIIPVVEPGGTRPISAPITRAALGLARSVSVRRGPSAPASRQTTRTAKFRVLGAVRPTTMPQAAGSAESKAVWPAARSDVGLSSRPRRGRAAPCYPTPGHVLLAVRPDNDHRWPDARCRKTTQRRAAGTGRCCRR